MGATLSLTPTYMFSHHLLAIIFSNYLMFGLVFRKVYMYERILHVSS